MLNRRSFFSPTEDQHEILGLNAEMFRDFLQFIANRRCTQIGLEQQYPGVANPFP